MAPERFFVSAYFRFGLRLCLNIRRQIHVSDSDMFLSLYLNMLHLVQSAVDEGFMVGRGSDLGRHPWCETACRTAQPMLGPRWRDQLVRLSIRFDIIASFTSILQCH